MTKEQWKRVDDLLRDGARLDAQIDDALRREGRYLRVKVEVGDRPDFLTWRQRLRGWFRRALASR